MRPAPHCGVIAIPLQILLMASCRNLKQINADLHLPMYALPVPAEKQISHLITCNVSLSQRQQTYSLALSAAAVAEAIVH